jgi:xanthine dehydrogenase iron-sulfur cluster and FAD-binding subunit A
MIENELSKKANYPRYQMTNSHILVHGFDYVEVSSLTAAIQVITQLGSRARILAGGTQLLVAMKMEREKPEVLVNIQKIPGMSQVSIGEKGELVLGAGVSIHAIRKDQYIGSAYPALAQACASFGSVQIELMGTIGGNICNGSPASDTVPALMAYDSELELVSAQGSRFIPIVDFYLGPGKTTLKPGELLKAIILPKPLPKASGVYLKISRVAADLAKASLAVVLVRDGSWIRGCKIALGSVAPIVFRARDAENYLLGKEYSDENCRVAAEMASAVCTPIDDVRSSAWYRRQVIKVMVMDALQSAWLKCEEEHNITHPVQVSVPLPVSQETSPQVTTKTEKRLVEMIINGKRKKMWVAPDELLLNVLRERLHLTGTKYGCGVGECSACTVQVDGQPALACLLLAISLDHCSVDTIEGIQKVDGTLDPLQESFIEHAAFQCGYCTPGLIMSLKGLLREIPKPDEDDIRDYLKGNRCRCTGYASIVRAVLDTVNPKPL